MAYVKEEMESLSRVEVHRVTYECDKCHGQVEFDDMILTSIPPKYPHHCSECGEKYVFETRYPTLVYKEVV